MPAKISYPRSVKEGSALATIYLNKKSDGYRSFTLAYYLDGQRKRETFSDEDNAFTRAKSIVQDIAKGETKKAEITPSDAHEMARAKRALAKAEMTCSIAEAVEHYCRIWQPRFQSKTVKVVVEEYRAACLNKSDKYKRELRFRLDAFCEVFGKRAIETVGTDEVEQFIVARKPLKGNKHLSERTKNNWYNLIRTVWIFAGKKFYLPLGHLAMTASNPYDDPGGASSKMDPDDLIELLFTMHSRDTDAHEFVPYIALMAFGGIRTEEAKRLTWEDVKMEGGRITIIDIPKGKGKKKSERRPVYVNPTLHEWLYPYKVEMKLKGKIISYDTADAVMRKNAKKIKIKWRHNMIRHTYITHFLRLSKRIEYVADQCGTSVSRIRENYRELGTMEEAIRWFTIPATFDLRPKQSDVDSEALRIKMGW